MSSGPSVLYAHRHPRGPSVGPVPLACVVVVEVGFALAVVLVAVDRRLLPVAGGVLALAVLVGLLRWRDRWIVRWLGLALRYRLRSRVRSTLPRTVGPRTAGVPSPDPAPIGTTGAVAPANAEHGGHGTDPRLRALRTLVGDLALTSRPDHDGRDVGLVGHAGAWSAVLAPDLDARADGRALLAATTAASTLGGRTDPTSTGSFPLGALAGTLSDRGVVLDALSAMWHCRPGGSDLDADAPALAAYREVLGPLPCLARREAWLVVRLDPTRCPDAVAERGGGTEGAHRALLGAVARIRRVLDDHDVPVRPLGPDEVLRAAVDAAVLGPLAGRPEALRLTEQWGAAVVGAVGHTTYGVTSWHTASVPTSLDALTGTGATATTVALTLEPGRDDPASEVGLRGTVRLAARSPDELATTGRSLREIADGLGLRLDPLDGQQAAGLATTLPLGTAP